MAVKNTLLNGLDWENGDILYADDLNDTFDRVVELTENGY